MNGTPGPVIAGPGRRLMPGRTVAQHGDRGQPSVAQALERRGPPHALKGGSLVARTSIADILALLGGPGLHSSTTDARERFRAFLRLPKWQPEDIRLWIDECLELAGRARTEYYYALQDIVVSIGVHLGFETEFGLYAATGADIPYDGRWQAVTGESILIEVKSSPWPLASVGQLGQYMDGYAAIARRRAHGVFGLYAIGHGDFTGIIDQIKGSDYRNRIKVVSFGDLLRLFALRDILERQMTAERAMQVIQRLLLPFESVNIGSIIEIIQGVAAGALTEPVGPDEPSGGPGDRQWRRSELRAFLDDCQANQVAMLLALCTAPGGELSSGEVATRMRLLAPTIPGLDAGQPFTIRTIGGARSGLSKREQQLGRDSVIAGANGCYRLREQYREWVVEWFTERGLWPVQMPLEPEVEEGVEEAPGIEAVG